MFTHLQLISNHGELWQFHAHGPTGPPHAKNCLKVFSHKSLAFRAVTDIRAIKR